MNLYPHNPITGPVTEERVTLTIRDGDAIAAYRSPPIVPDRRTDGEFVRASFIEFTHRACVFPSYHHSTSIE